MASPALEQQCEHVLRDSGAKARRPPNDLELVHVAHAVHVSTGIEQSANYFHPARTAGKVQRIRVVTYVARIWIGAMLEQQPHGAHVLDREMQTGAALRSALAHEARLTRQQIAERRDISGRTSRKERRKRGSRAG